MEKDELTYNIIGCAMKVHNTLCNGFQDVIYQRCLAIELAKAGIGFVREPIISRGSSHNCTNYLQLLRKANKLRQHHR